jgi:hypothetical protein
MEADRQLASEQTEELGGAADVIEVTVGVEDHRRAETGGMHTVDDFLRFLAGIDDHHLSGIGVTEQNAVCLYGTNRKNVEEERGCHRTHRMTFLRIRNSEFGIRNCLQPSAAIPAPKFEIRNPKSEIKRMLSRQANRSGLQASWRPSPPP